MKSKIKHALTGLLLATPLLVRAAAIIDVGPLEGVLPDGGFTTVEAEIGFPVNFFGTTYTKLFVSDDGCVSFNFDCSTTFGVYGLAEAGQPVIAPFLADVDTSGGHSDTAPSAGVVQYGKAQVDIGGGFFLDGFVVNWIDVGHFIGPSKKRNRFQLILLDNSIVGDSSTEGDFIAIFNYDKIEWETGDSDGGVDGLGGKSVRVGFTNGNPNNTIFFELKGSGVNGALVDSNSSNPTTALIKNRIPSGSIPTTVGNIPVPFGRYMFFFFDGKVGRSDLAIAMVADPKQLAVVGQDFQYIIFVKNFGRDGTFADVKFNLGPDTAFVSALSSCTGGNDASRTIKCSLGDLAKGQTVTIPIKVTPIVPGVIKSTAIVRTLGAFDPNLANNKVTANTDPNKCGGQTLRRAAPLSVKFHPTGTNSAVNILAITVQNIGLRGIELVSVSAKPNEPFTVTGILPLLPFTIASGATESFQVRTERAAGLSREETTAPYVDLGIRCAP